MNLVGKIFTVLIFLLCVIFTAMATMVFATHHYWLAENTKNLDLLKAERTKCADLILQKEALDQKMKKDHDDQEKHLAELEQQINLIETKLTADEKLLVDKEDQIRSLAAAVNGATATLASLRADAESLRNDIRAARAERDDRYKALVKATDELHNALGEKDRLGKSNAELAALYAKATDALNWYKIPWKTQYKEKDPPADLEGEVTSALDQTHIEISVGSDDGLKVGHTLEIVRLSTHAYVGRVQVTEVSPNRAVCRPVPNMQRTPIQKGDHVYANLSRFK
jgi:flagellar motility protein MotE (MotC chaperone)